MIPSRIQKLLNKPGFLSDAGGSKKVRDWYSDEANNVMLNESLMTPFACHCMYGRLSEVKKAVESGYAPDLTQTETEFKTGYISIVVLAAQRLKGPIHLLQHKETLHYLISMGCPVDVPDLLGYTALWHMVINYPRLDLARILLEEGKASPNVQNKFGDTPLIGCITQNQIEAIELLMEFGADLDLKDANGDSSRSLMMVAAGPTVRAAIAKWERKRQNLPEPTMENANGCRVCGKDDVKLRLCAKCRLAKYCSPECQKKDWPDHKKRCNKTKSQSITVKPNYTMFDGTLKNVRHLDMKSLKSSIRQAQYEGTSVQVPSEPEKSPKKGRKPVSDEKSNMIVKIQLPVGMTPGGWVAASADGPGYASLMVYNAKRTFQATLLPNEPVNVEPVRELRRIIEEQGTKPDKNGKGLMAYFQADLISRDELVIHVGEVLAPQPF